MSLMQEAGVAGRRSPIVPAALLAVTFAAGGSLYWYGMGPGDAERYLEAALRWQNGAWLGDTHWALRHLFVLPMAASFKLFGASEVAAILPNVLYAALTVMLTWSFGRRHLGEREAFIAAALIALSAFFVARPLELDVYGAEAFFAALAVWLFIASRDGRARFLVATGLTAGLAWTVREQSLYLIAAFGLLILKDQKRPLRSIAFLAAGFGAVIAIEVLIYAIAAGDLFHRYRIDLSHRDIGVNAAMTPERARLAARAGRLASYLASTPATTPMLLLAAISLLYLRRARAYGSDTAKSALRTFAVVSAISAIVASLAFNVSATRYYPLLTYAAFLIVAVAIARLHVNRRPRAAIAAALAVVVINVAAADFTRAGDYQEARVLASLAKASREPIYADSLTVNRARYQLRLAGWSAEEAAGQVRNERFADSRSLFFRTSRARTPASSSCVIEQIFARRNGWTHALLRESGLARLLGPRAVKIAARPEPSLLVRWLDAPAAVDTVTGRPCLPNLKRAD